MLAAREVFGAIAALPDDQRDVLAAVDVAGLSYQEAADALDVPVGTIMSRLYRGRNRVAETVGPELPAVDLGLAGKRALVTGASGGIGQAVARELAAEGVEVVAHYHRNAEAAGRSAGSRSAPTCATRRRSMRCSSRPARSTCAWPTPACGRARTSRWPSCRSSAGGTPSTAT